ncbi:cupin [Kaistia geumhonensis]|uniref:Uncharacterized protein YjlB n=1 Tax=Kaistia geumhonensis TaxID=410839 RepID=A0ABU0M1J6_9HYPH|nr:cupin [Kaistia geumhonensis]MCX5479945.1 cupin [Kaistia geumhonensis]MDQ0514827.1 uncharacterized protein YjlB [Kaistia geumhonensis]
MKIETIRLADAGEVPNHPHWSLILYAQAAPPDASGSATAALDALFAGNGWPVSWHDGIYRFTHFHSVTHEALGIGTGSARVQFGGESGPILTVAAGDAVLLPAGTGHKLIEASSDLLVVGAYPPGAGYDLVRAGEGDGAELRRRIAAVPCPRSDPVTGRTGGLLAAWIED